MEKLARPTAEAEGSPARSLSSPEWWREEEEACDGRDLPISGRVRGRARAVPAWAERKRAGLRAGFQAIRCVVAFSFFCLSNFCFIFDFAY